MLDYTTWDDVPNKLKSIFCVTIAPEQIDHNGHLAMSEYLAIFGRLTDFLLAEFGIDARYLEKRRCFVFVAEAQLIYRREVFAGEQLQFAGRIADHSQRKLTFDLAMFRKSDRFMAATGRITAVHVDLQTRKSVVFPPSIFKLINQRKMDMAQLDG